MPLEAKKILLTNIPLLKKEFWSTPEISSLIIQPFGLLLTLLVPTVVLAELNVQDKASYYTIYYTSTFLASSLAAGIPVAVIQENPKKRLKNTIYIWILFFFVLPTLVLFFILGHALELNGATKVSLFYASALIIHLIVTSYYISAKLTYIYDLLVVLPSMTLFISAIFSKIVFAHCDHIALTIFLSAGLVIAASSLSLYFLSLISNRHVYSPGKWVSKYLSSSRFHAIPFIMGECNQILPKRFLINRFSLLFRKYTKAQLAIIICSSSSFLTISLVSAYKFGDNQIATSGLILLIISALSKPISILAPRVLRRLTLMNLNANASYGKALRSYLEKINSFSFSLGLMGTALVIITTSHKVLIPNSLPLGNVGHLLNMTIILVAIIVAICGDVCAQFFQLYMNSLGNFRWPILGYLVKPCVCLLFLVLSIYGSRISYLFPNHGATLILLSAFSLSSVIGASLNIRLLRLIS